MEELPSDPLARIREENRRAAEAKRAEMLRAATQELLSETGVVIEQTNESQ